MNDVHFTNVIVNVFENAIKYSDVPDIDVYTENIKDMILIKVQDKGLGMSKVAQKRVLKSLIENTLEIYNVRSWFRFLLTLKGS
jgi:two-component system phosphate regulon sensor histidine kinase PhoR